MTIDYCSKWHRLLLTNGIDSLRKGKLRPRERQRYYQLIILQVNQDSRAVKQEGPRQAHRLHFPVLQVNRRNSLKLN